MYEELQEQIVTLTDQIEEERRRLRECQNTVADLKEELSIAE